MNRRIAVIDLGTNTFNLLIVEMKQSGHEIIYSTKEGVGLGLGGINESMISKEAMARGVEALSLFKIIGGDHHVEEFHLFGTSAIRNASNREEFLQRVKLFTGFEIKVISGDEEARLIFEGVSSGHIFDQPALIMDIGGGSTEFIFADSSGPIKARSFEIGVSRIYQMFTFSDPITLNDEQKIETYLDEMTGDFFDSIQTSELIGASGSFETFYELSVQQRYPKNEYVKMANKDMQASLDQIIKSTLAEREMNDLIIPIRKKMAPIAAVKIRWILNKLNIEHVTISPFSLKEGVLRTEL